MIMYFHWQNLNDKKGGRKGSGFRHGRCWLRIARKLGCQCEWLMLSKFFGLTVDVGGGEEDIQLFMAIPPIAIWLGFSGLSLPKRLSQAWPRSTGIRIFDWAIWFDLWRDDSGWARNDWRERGLHASWHFRDTLLGMPKYYRRVIEEREAYIPMPEGPYPATVIMTECTWKRPRWFSRQLLRAEVEIHSKHGIPYPGKGENAWDCGMDGTYSITMPADSVSDAISKTVKSCMESRRRYGGSELWMPPKEYAIE